MYQILLYIHFEFFVTFECSFFCRISFENTELCIKMDDGDGMLLYMNEELSQKQTHVIFLDFLEKSLEKTSKTMEVY